MGPPEATRKMPLTHGFTLSQIKPYNIYEHSADISGL